MILVSVEAGAAILIIGVIVIALRRWRRARLHRWAMRAAHLHQVWLLEKQGLM